MTNPSDRFNAAAAAHHEAMQNLLARVKTGEEAIAELATTKAQLAAVTGEYNALLDHASSYLEETTSAIAATAAPASASAGA
jgi:hypothetical protein